MYTLSNFPAVLIDECDANWLFGNSIKDTIRVKFTGGECFTKAHSRDGLIKNQSLIAIKMITFVVLLERSPATVITIVSPTLNIAKMRVFEIYAIVSNCFLLDIAESNLDESILTFGISAIQLYGVSSTIPL